MPISGEPPYHNSSARILFTQLADWWHLDTNAMSSPSQKRQHEAYLRIIKAGPIMVPYILEDLVTRGGDWYEALRQITLADPDPVPLEHRGQTKLMTDDWIAWADQHLRVNCGQTVEKIVDNPLDIMLR